MGGPARRISLAGLAIALGATEHGGPLSPGEERLVREAAAWPAPPDPDVQDAADAIRAGGGSTRRSADRCTRPQPQRRQLGQVFTPAAITGPMVGWTLDQSPTRVIDAGCGSGRFALESRAAQRCGNHRNRRRPTGDPADARGPRRAGPRGGRERRQRRLHADGRFPGTTGAPPSSAIRPTCGTTTSPRMQRPGRASRPGASGRAPRAWRDCTRTSSSRPPCTGGPATSAASSPAPSGST